MALAPRSKLKSRSCSTKAIASQRSQKVRPFVPKVPTEFSLSFSRSRELQLFVPNPSSDKNHFVPTFLLCSTSRVLWKTQKVENLVANERSPRPLHFELPYVLRCSPFLSKQLVPNFLQKACAQVDVGKK